ncbi:MAG: hypothetical protein QM724_07885 [Flavobacteriales bacterium]
MDKRGFLRTSGLLGMAGLLPVSKLSALAPTPPRAEGSCVLIPTETAGPFPLDLTANSLYFRQDIREDRSGAPLRLRLRILGLQNCEPMNNVRVNIWHCDAGGAYSGYTNQQGGLNTTGLTFLRGYQFTDSDGRVEFVTIFPGWYNGRVCHIHFQVYVSSSYSAISQLTFPITEKQAVYTSNPTLYPSGTDPLTPSQDSIFSDGYQYQLSTLTYNEQTQEYEAFLEVTVQGSGIPTGILERNTAEQFEVGQNMPNPYSGSTTIPVMLKQAGDVLIDLHDLQGRKVGMVRKDGLPAGRHAILVDMEALGLPTANYVYQVQITNANGVWRTCKMMTAMR